jgi:hypothetical protein
MCFEELQGLYTERDKRVQVYILMLRIYRLRGIVTNYLLISLTKGIVATYVPLLISTQVKLSFHHHIRFDQYS